jgi:hypothetical protein
MPLSAANKRFCDHHTSCVAAAAAAAAAAICCYCCCYAQVDPGSEPGWVKVQLTAAGSGWLGFGVADPGGFLTETLRQCQSVTYSPAL